MCSAAGRWKSSTAPSNSHRYIRNATTMTPDHPVLVDKYLLGKEVEVDAICDGEDVLIPGIMEHIERAGVHSGDSFAVYPGINLFPAEIETIVDYTTRIALAIGALGLINIQYVIHGGRHLCAGSESALVAHGAVPEQGHRRADGPPGHEYHARQIAGRAGISRADSGRGSRLSRSKRRSSRWRSCAVSKSISARR